MENIKIINALNCTQIRDERDLSQTLFVEVADLDCVSDGYHTIGELYDHRITLFIALCRQCCLWNESNTKDVWRSKLHSDGSEMKGWYLLGIGKDTGSQISYHIPLSRWDETNFAETLEKAPDFDGHSSVDVLERLKKL